MITPVRTLSAMLLAAALLAPVGLTSSVPEPRSLGDDLRAQLSAEIRSHGLDPTLFFDQPTELVVQHADGTTETLDMTFGEAVARIVGDATYAPAEAGFGGTPSEVVAGDFIHIASSLVIGSSALPYQVVSRSNVVPSTPPVAVPVFDPTGATPVIPMIVYDVGGPTYNVKGSYNVLGMHTAGSAIPAASTAESGPYLPQKDMLVLLSDWTIDFVGHAAITQSQACFFGICVGVGVMLAGAGIAQFDAQPVVLPTGHQTTTAFPILP